MTSSVIPDRYFFHRQQMVERQLRARGIADERVLSAMSRVPRHLFAPESCRAQAYEDHPLPIAKGQTISQPYIVALMLEALALSPADKALEIGTGSGYVAALLAEMVSQAVSIERHALLADSARLLLSDLGYGNVRVVVGDGSRGFPESAPYDAVLVSAAAPELPNKLVDQLADGGRMIVPVGSDETQQLQFVYKNDGQIKTRVRELCRFVPLITEE